MSSKKSFEPAQFECDRRLSRAARELLKRRLLPLLPHHSLHESVNDTLRQSIRDASTCILHPDRDILLQDEEHSKRIPAGPSRLLPRKHATHWYQCSYCGKVFLTRYYLDLHLETMHHYSRNVTIANVCPAVDYCQILGGCHHVALELEPYYGRGSGGFGPDAFQVRQMWSRRLQPCNEVVLKEESQPACRAVIRQCFQEHDLVENMIAGVCDTMTCHNRLHQLAGNVVWHVHTWKHEWELHHNHGVGWVGIVLVLSLLAYYIVMYAHFRRPVQPRNRLLSKKATSSSKLNVFGRTPTKKKLH